MAAHSGHGDTVAFLVEELGADVRARDRFGLTPLHYALVSSHRSQRLADVLRSRGATITDPATGETIAPRESEEDGEAPSGSGGGGGDIDTNHDDDGDSDPEAKAALSQVKNAFDTYRDGSGGKAGSSRAAGGGGGGDGRGGGGAGEVEVVGRDGQTLSTPVPADMPDAVAFAKSVEEAGRTSKYCEICQVTMPEGCKVS